MRIFTVIFAILFAGLTSSASAQLPADAVILSKVKIPESQKSTDLCPVRHVASNPELATWTHQGVLYRGHADECQSEFEQDPERFAAAARYKRWENNFVAAMSLIWCPVTDEVNPGGGKQWNRLGLVWESCCTFCNEDFTEEDFPTALERLKGRARQAYQATGGLYVATAASPVEGAIRQPEDAEEETRLLYVAAPGVRNYLEYGGHGVLVFDIDGALAYPSTGDVIDTASRKIIATLEDEDSRLVQSEKMLEIDFRGNQPVRAGDQFGIGRK